jgi:hypothetical protein
MVAGASVSHLCPVEPAAAGSLTAMEVVDMHVGAQQCSAPFRAEPGRLAVVKIVVCV